jgi:hypothetical protein
MMPHKLERARLTRSTPSRARLPVERSRNVGALSLLALLLALVFGGCAKGDAEPGPASRVVTRCSGSQCTTSSETLGMPLRLIPPAQ